MEELVCPNCGSTDFVEVWDDTFQCEDCGNLVDEEGCEI